MILEGAHEGLYLLATWTGRVSQGEGNVLIDCEWIKDWNG